MRALHLISEATCLQHDTGGGEHPEVPGRLTAIADRLEKGRLSPHLKTHSSARCEWKRILAAHEEGYLFRFEEASLSGRPTFDHSDNRISFDSFAAALTAAGAGPVAVDLVEADPAGVHFCSVRPPGHHAEAARAMGFCFLNNVVIAARYWRETYARRRILVFDFDAHHGNGIQRAFEKEGEILYVSIHEHPTFSFPGTGYAAERGIGEGEGATLNVPLQPGASDGEVRALLDDLITPAVERFGPEAIVVSAGFDGHVEDDMSGLGYSTELFGIFGETVERWARTFCGGRAVSILEGGYHLAALAASVEAYLGGLSADPAKEEEDVR
jgi:acetoin utilization deacetylase AcuC-like enzyme